MPPVDALARLIALAEQLGVSPALLRAAARQLVDLEDQAAAADARRLSTLERGRSISRLRDQGMRRSEICDRLAISVDAYARADRAWRDSRQSPAVERRAATGD